MPLDSLPGFEVARPRRRRARRRQQPPGDDDAHPPGDENSQPPLDEAAPTTYLRNFKFQNIGEIVAVYYVQDYWLGQVSRIRDEASADIDFLVSSGTPGGRRTFRWPRPSKFEEEVPAYCVFAANLVLTPVSAGGRAFEPEGSDLQASYEAFRAHLHEQDE